MKKITALAEIHTGYPFRTGVRNDPHGKYAVIQIRDLHNYSTIPLERDNLALVSDVQPKTHHFVKKNDILFVAKGANNYAVRIDRSLENTVAGPNFLLIRPKNKKIVPAYLVWYINQQPAQKFLQERAKGSYIPSISKTALSEMEIPLPPHEVQQKIVRLHALAQDEMRIRMQILIKRQQMIEALLLKKIRQN
jgi:restriction endonuclease S subunit